MTEFVKLYGSILDSTVWLEALPTKVVWITMLAMADWEGFVSAAVPTLAKRAGVTRNDCEAALVVLGAPDPDSKTKEFEGRRIEQTAGGWKILNHGKYRDMRTERQVKTAERVAKHRASKKEALPVTDVTAGNAVKRSVRTDVDKETTTTVGVTRNAYAFMGKIRPVWKKAYGGEVPAGSAKLLLGSATELGEEELVRRFTIYCEATEGQFASVRRFVTTIGTWDGAKRNGHPSQEEQHRKRGILL